MNLQILEIKVEWGHNAPLEDLRTCITNRLKEYGDPLRWAITNISKSNQKDLPSLISIEAVVISHEPSILSE